MKGPCSEPGALRPLSPVVPVPSLCECESKGRVTSVLGYRWLRNGCDTRLQVPQRKSEYGTFVLFLENFAPLVNSLNLGIANPLLLGPSPLHFAQIKTQLALQQLNAVTSHGSTTPYTLLNQAFLKIAMSGPRFNPRENFPLQRPHAPHPSGMRPPGPFMRPGSMDLPRFYPAGRASGIPHRFAGHESYQSMGPQRMNVEVTQHRTDPRLTKEKLNFHEAQQKKGKPHGSRWDGEPHISASVGVKQSSVTRVTEQSPKVQSRYTKESASSILASFGLSNEDLEELSRYPDEQLTPENMPLILRDIRMRKMGRRLPNLHSQNRNKETLGSEGVSSNVIDYGHASKYGYTEDPLELGIYDPEMPTDEVKNEFQSQQGISAPVPTPNVLCNSMFPVEEVFRQVDFPRESSNNQSFFPAESGTKISSLHISGGQPVLEPVKSVGQPISQTVSQRMSQSLIPPSMNQRFSSELISVVSQQERVPHEPVIHSPNVHVGSRGSKKNYQPESDIPIQSPFGVVKASWLPKFSHADAQKMKRLPTPSMMNDYYAASPRIFPHLCSLCNVECSHLKLRKDQSLHYSSVLLISELPEDGCTEEEIRKVFQPFGKVNDVLIVPYRKEAYLEMEFKEAITAVMKYIEATPVLIKGKSVKICVPEKKKAQNKEVKKKTLDSKKASALKKDADASKAVETVTSASTGKTGQAKASAAKINKSAGKSANSVKSVVTVAAKGNKGSVKTAKSTGKKSLEAKKAANVKIKDASKAVTIPENSEIKTNMEVIVTENNAKEIVSEAALETTENEPISKETEEMCLVLISNLPAKGYSIEEVYNLAKPFGGLKDILVLSSHQKEESEKALCDSDFAIETLEIETQGEEIKVDIPLEAATPASIELFTENVEESALIQPVYTGDFEKEEAEIINPEIELSTSDSALIEERDIKGILEESPSDAEDFFSRITQSMVEAVADMDKHETVSEIMPPVCVLTLVPGNSTGDERAVNKKAISEKTNMEEKEENEFDVKETSMHLEIETEKVEKNEAGMVAEKVEKIMAIVKEKPAENTVIEEAYPNKGLDQANKPDETSKTSMLAVSNVSSSKAGIKAAVVSSKAKAIASKTENQKSFLKSVLRDQINAEKKLSAKEFGLLKPASARSGVAESSSKFKPTQGGVTRGGSGRISALQGKDSKLDYRDITKQSQETEARPSIMKREDSNNKQEPLFPFNLDEFVTVDEVIEEVHPSQAKQNPLKGKRKEVLKSAPPSDLNLKKKKGKTSIPRGVEGELSFVTLDEIGEEEDAAAHLAQALVTVDEVIDEEELNMEEMVKNSHSLLTLDELIDQDDCISHSEPKDVTVLSVVEEQDLLKQERLVTVDEIGEVEELPLNESADITFATLNTKGDEGNTVRDSIGFISSQMPEDPSALVTVDEIQDDSSDLHLLTLDEVTEEDEDSLADFNNLKEELNFVTVDEVGEEEEGDSDLKIELTQSKNDHPTDKKGERKKRALDTKKTKFEALSQVGPVSENVMDDDLKTVIERHLPAKAPTKRVRIGKGSPTEKAVKTEPVKDEEAFQISEVDEESGLKDSEPERKRKKIDDSSLGKSVVPDVSEELDFLVPKAGFFCPICSLFYSDEKAMTNHCKSTRHKQNTEADPLQDCGRGTGGRWVVVMKQQYSQQKPASTCRPPPMRIPRATLSSIRHMILKDKYCPRPVYGCRLKSQRHPVQPEASYGEEYVDLPHQELLSPAGPPSNKYQPLCQEEKVGE
ncbi:Zinc finger protein 638 [Tupaia chinensis]|uniref:Zinc finger protein 638 n=1 Tax=Tupaia chinensis TaxID=246437 RepID=L9KM80_TUPCH|nr:Zinc finger protein 638 [Tupaia chinensis]